MKPAFNILPEPFNQDTLKLLIEAGNYGISFTWFTRYPDSIEGILVYNLDQVLTPTEWLSALNEIYREQPLLQKTCSSVCFCVNFPDSMLVPGEYYNQATAKEMLISNFQTGPEYEIRTDVLKEQKIFNVYGIRKELFEFFQHHHPNLKISHSSSLELQNIPEDTSLTCIIYHNSFKVFAHHQDKFLYCGSFGYSKPVDTAYYLLKICDTYGLKPDQVPLRLSGMIDEYSILYNEMYKYFMNVSFIPAREGVNLHDRIRFYPSHFFSHQTFLITCAS